MKRLLSTILAAGMLASMFAGCAAQSEASSTAAATPQTSSVAPAAPDSKPDSSMPVSSTAEKSAEKSNDFADGTQAYEDKGIACEIPQNWRKVTHENGNDYFYAPVKNGNAFLTIQRSDVSGSILNGNNLQGLAGGMEKSFSSAKRTKCEIEENDAGTKYGVIHLEGQLQGITGRFYYAVFDVQGGITCLSFLLEDGCEKDPSDDFWRIINTVVVREEPATQGAEGQLTEPEAKAPAASETMGQRNARSKARDYLSVMPFSYSGLVSQLEYEGFTTEEATYAADQCGADWNEQAAKKAQDYLDTMSFSRSGLIEQLKYEGFTQEQAEYGVAAVGY